MGKKALLLLLTLVYFLLCGCAPAPAETPANSSDATLHTQETHLAENTQSSEEFTTTQKTQQTEFVVDPLRAWTPNCEEFIYLWESAQGGNALTEIPLGDTLQLEKWYGRYAAVTYKGIAGYVSANYIKPAADDYFSGKLSVIAPTCRYTYQQMLTDMDKLQMRYPQLVRLESIGTSEEGRRIPVMQVGNPNAQFQVLIQGAMHGREHFTAWLAMAVADCALLNNAVCDAVCYHIIPMSNPDGVCISQSGALGDAQTAIYREDLALGYTSAAPAAYARQWKANALGVDLNRNFSAGWEESLEREQPSSEKHRGDTPFCAAESRALRDYTLKYTFDATVSLHSHGSVIYYQYGSKQPVNKLSYSFAQTISQFTGYIPTAYDNTTGAGYKDWAMEELGIPSLTLEIGSYTTPLEQRDIYNTFDRCKDLLSAIYKWLSQQ